MRKIALWASVSAVLVSIAACAPAPPPDTTAADTAAINAVRSGYQTAWNAGETAAMAALFASDAIVMDNGMPTVSGTADIKTTFDNQFSQMTPGSLTITSDEMQLMGDWAFDRGTFSASMTPKAAGAAPVSDSGRYLVILHKQADGSWKIARDIGNTPTPPMPAPAGK